MMHNTINRLEADTSRSNGRMAVFGCSARILAVIQMTRILSNR